MCPYDLALCLIVCVLYWLKSHYKTHTVKEEEKPWLKSNHKGGTGHGGSENGDIGEQSTDYI